MDNTNSNRDVVINVVSALEETRQNDFEELESEFEDSARLINGIIESWKRKFIESGAISDYKKARTSSTTTLASVGSTDKENSHPNANNAQKKKSHKKTSSSSASTTSTSATLKQRQHQPVPMDAVNEQHKQTHSGMDLDIDVNSLKVAELRKHLRSFGLDQQGLKRTLQLRLQCAIDEQKENERQREMKLEEKRGRKEEEEEEQQQQKKEDPEPEIVTADSPMDIVEEKRASIGSAGMEAENIGAEDDFVDNVVDNDIVRMDTDSVGVNEDEEQSKPIFSTASAATSSTVEEDATHSQPHHTHTQQPLQSNKSPKKKPFGSKIIKATTKLFSPNKNKKKSPKDYQQQQHLENESSMDVQMEDASSSASRHGSESEHVTSTSSKMSGNSNNQDTCPPSENMSPNKRASMVCEMSISEINKEREKGNNEAKTEPRPHPHPLASSQNLDHPSSLPNIPSTASKLDIGKSKSTMSSTPVLKVAGAPLSSSKVQAKKREMDEARKARLDRIRNKVAQAQASIAVPYSSSKSASAIKSGKIPLSKDSAEERKKAIAAKMRSKVIAGSTSSKTSNATTVVGASTNQPQPAPTDTISTPGNSYKDNTLRQNQQQQQQAKKVRSPMETYEMSDRDDSDSDASDESEYYEERHPKKKVPKWAQKDRLIPALEKQFIDNEDKLDPDEIFHEVLTCDLEAIFGHKKKRYTKRASTGNWTKDRVTASEKLVYKRKMGFSKKK